MAEKLKGHKAVVITGDTARNARQKAIDDFQSDPHTRIFIGQITATNSAITLTASDNVLIMEPSWTPAENVQAAARAHRIGQKSSSVLARYVVLAGSVDEDLTRVLIRKSKQISEIMI
jgi:SNF2 family DNA or RNA helicase